MIRSNIRKAVAFTTLFSFGQGDPDTVVKNTKTSIEADISVVKEETGWERIQQLFNKDDFGRIGPELNTIIQVTWMSTFFGGLYGGIIHSREAYLDFIKNNQATVFRDHVEAKRKLQDQVTLSFAKGAFKWAWRLTFFCGTYATITTTIAAYRGKTGILEHVIAGIVAGSTYKFNMGPRGWIVGGGLGAVLGIIGGSITTAVLGATGMTMEEVRYWNYKWVNARNEANDEALKKRLQSEQLKLLTERELNLSKSDQTLDSIELNVKTNNKK